MRLEGNSQPHDDVQISEDSPLILPLRALGRRDLSTAGGKGANLGELVRAGFPVPEGFVVSTVAYDRFVAHNRLEETVAGALRSEEGGDALRKAFQEALIPPDVTQAVLAAYRELGGGPVAVRSSATAEDLPKATFAGQQDTFLNVVGDDAVLDATRRCWASLWTDRAIAYRSREGIGQQTVKLAVVIQRLVDAEVAGVLFTANPITGALDEIVVDASPGLGEAVVSGVVTPDHFLLDKRSAKVKERRAGRREVVVRTRPDGGTEQVEGAVAPWAPALPDRTLRELGRLGAAIERHFGSPQDVEWAWAAGQLFILQARPLTGLPEPMPRPSRMIRTLSPLFAEMFPVRPYPLDMTTWVPAISAAAVEPIFSLIGVDAPSIPEMFAVEDGVPIRFTGTVRLRPTPAILLAPARLLGLALRYDPALERADPLLLKAQSRVRALERLDLEQLPWEGLLSTVREALGLVLPLAGETRRRYYPRALLAAGFLRATLALAGHGDHFGTLLSGVDSTTLEANRALEVLAGRVRSNPTLADAFRRHEPGELQALLETQPTGRTFLAELRAFLDRYGHREAVLSTVMQPTWKDAPEVVLGLVKGFALAEPRQKAERPAWEAARDEVLTHPLLRIAPLRAAFPATLKAARYLWRIREDTHFDATSILPVLRRTLLELGRRLAIIGVLDAPEEVFHLKLSELERVDAKWPPPPTLAEELRSSALRRKERRAALEGKPLIDPRLFQVMEPEGEAAQQGDILLRGMPGSPGVAEGPSRVVRDSSEFGKLRQGEVLVAPYTNPAWTPLFQRAAAVVVDAGGAGSHAAIVAREYGIPAVMATVDGTSRLQDGQQVRVDGSRGLVLKISERSSGQPPR